MLHFGALLALLGAATAQCLNGYTLFGNDCFTVKTQALTWAQAEATCRDDGGNLASFHDNLGYWEIEIYAGTARTGQPLYTTTSFSPFNETLKLSSSTPQFYIVLQVEQNNDVNPFVITYSGTDQPLYPIPTQLPRDDPLSTFARTGKNTQKKYF
ncbi:unnamed protein product, partial [Mesorhabditis belari]|uniref:C-type lectin domain-containing protein n=1 Tax=Mesorhabditis belari TaxID=2138241 RepID=A0AAF3FUA0_9BILA